MCSLEETEMDREIEIGMDTDHAKGNRTCDLENDIATEMVNTIERLSNPRRLLRQGNNASA